MTTYKSKLKLLIENLTVTMKAVKPELSDTEIEKELTTLLKNYENLTEAEQCSKIGAATVSYHFLETLTLAERISFIEGLIIGKDFVKTITEVVLTEDNYNNLLTEALKLKDLSSLENQSREYTRLGVAAALRYALNNKLKEKTKSKVKQKKSIK